MPEILVFVLKAFIVYRVARLIAVDYGPFDVFAKLRTFFGKRAHKNISLKTLADGINCQYCVGFWVSLVIALLFSGPFPWWGDWLALAGAQAFLADLAYKE